MGDTTGTATTKGESPQPAIKADGDCLRDTLRALAASGRLDAPAIDRVRSDALDLLSKIVSVYEVEVAPREVGATGTGRATESQPAQHCTGLLYGRVQSGKTMAMIALVAAAMDNGFRVVVVLTSDNVKLAAQTTDRFRAALEPHGPLTRDALSPEEWQTDDRHLSKHLADAGALFVCSKNKARLEALNDFLVRIGAPSYPALILDDEADQATPDMNTAKRSRAKSKNQPAPDPTAIHRAVVDSLRVTLLHHVFLQVTATPYALLLQTVGTALRPSFGRLLEPGIGYTGGDVFFEREQITEDGLQPPLAEVDENESDNLEHDREAPEGLQRAIAFFMVASTAQAMMEPDAVRAGQNFLCHTSQLRQQHRHLEGLVKAYVAKVEDSLASGDLGLEPMRRLDAAHQDLLRTCPSAPPLAEVLPQLQRRLMGRKVIVVNSETDAVFGRSMNFVVGGNILGRGVTIDNLLVTYYLRQPKLGQMDTMLQHARMYGYRTQLMPFTRVFLPLKLAIRFQEIHRMEQRLRRQLASNEDMAKPIVIERTGKELKVTRAGVLDADYVDLFEPEDQRYPMYPQLWLKKGEWDAIRERIAALLGGSLRSTDPRDPKPITFDTIIDLVEGFPYDRREPSMSWVPGALCRVLERQRERCGGRAWLYAREMHRRVRYLDTGILSGPEVNLLRQHGAPVFCAFWDHAAKIKTSSGEEPARAYWHPTLVFDAKMPRVVVNVSPT